LRCRRFRKPWSFGLRCRRDILRGRCGKAVAEGKRRLRRNGCGRRDQGRRSNARGLRRNGGDAGCEACRRRRDMRIETGAVELRIRARCENVGIDRPGATEHKHGRRRACDEDLRACCSGWCSTLGCRETDRGNSTGTHPDRIQTGPTPIPSWPPFDLVHSPSTANGGHCAVIRRNSSGPSRRGTSSH
jgi:hypothetical protein